MKVRTLSTLLGATLICLSLAGVSNVIQANPLGQSAQNAPASSSKEADQCIRCHAAKVAGFTRSKMANSMRTGGQEPAGIVQIGGTTIRMYSDKNGSWQSLERNGSTRTYHVDYVIGSATHASGFLIDLGDHLLQSPVAYYTSREAYGMAPGFEAAPDPDFTRPVGAGCVFCHAGSFSAVAGTMNEYGATPFPHLAIGCNRCHGDASAHLADPDAGNIVNPENLDTSARDSICEQCHLIGLARVLNPGKRFSDFQAGEPLEDVFTVYHSVAPKGTEARFRVISHSEQLALSKCKISSGQQMWCGTCHDPHDEPTETVSFYRQRCLRCHAHTSFLADHPSRTSDCISCHMPKRDAKDGGHTTFTDHRIQRIPEDQPAAEASSVVAWRDPPVDLATRNLGIALVEIGTQRSSPKQVVDGYRMLTEVQQKFSGDSEMYNSIGNALYMGRQYGEAVQAFELAVRFDPISSQKEASLGQAYAALGDQKQAERHLEEATELDPLNLSAATHLIGIYNRNGETAKADELSKKITGLASTTIDRK